MHLQMQGCSSTAGSTFMQELLDRFRLWQLVPESIAPVNIMLACSMRCAVHWKEQARCKGQQITGTHTCRRRAKLYPQQLQHGLADFCVHIDVLEELLLQPNRLPQVGVRLAEHIVQLQCFLNRRHCSLQRPSSYPFRGYKGRIIDIWLWRNTAHV